MTRAPFLLGLAFFLLGRSLSLAADEPAATSAKAALNAKTLGAKGDGVTKDTAVFQKALDDCTAAGGGTVTVPRGVYLIGSLSIGSNTTLQLEKGASLLGSPDPDDYPLLRVRWEGEFAQGRRALLFAEKADHVTISGGGSIFGPPVNVSRLRNPRGPALIEFNECTNVLLEGFSTQYQNLWSIHPMMCKNFTARNLIIRTINNNGDGIDVDSCEDVLIEHCDINTGDDAIALKSGRGLAALKLERPTQRVVIRDCLLVSSIFAGVGFGTEMSGGIRNVRVENCTIAGRSNALFFKSRNGRGGFIEDVTCENISIYRSGTAICVELTKHGIQASDPVPGEVDQWAQLRNIRFNNIRVDGVKTLVAAKDVPPEKPIEGLALTNITGDCARGITLANITGAKLADIRVTGFEGELLSATNVKGEGLEKAVVPTPVSSDAK